MDISDDLPELSVELLQLFEWICERAVRLGDSTVSISVADDASVSSCPGGMVGLEAGVMALVDGGYMQRESWRQYVITQHGFQMYARASIAGYEETEQAVKDAVAAVDHTDTDVIVASTGTSRYLVNHILRVLQRRRDIGAFVAASNSIYVTRVSDAFKLQQAAGKPAAAKAPASGPGRGVRPGFEPSLN